MQSVTKELNHTQLALEPTALLELDDPAGVVVVAPGGVQQEPLGRFLMERLWEQGFSSVLVPFDNRLPDELQSPQNLLQGVLEWVRQQEGAANLPLGLLAGGEMAGAAVRLAVDSSPAIGALVLYSSQLEKAGSLVRRLTVPTLLVVGEHDAPRARLNEAAFVEMPARSKMLAVVPATTGELSPPEAAELLGTLAADWFGRYLVPLPVVRR
jgi:pimeloyl-ACP methyl ester carboxylesterase